MRMILSFFLVIFSAGVQAQQDVNTVSNKEDRVSFIVQFDSTQMRKHGFYLNGYMVNIPDSKAGEFHGKQIRIRGRACVIKKLDENEAALRQGYTTDVFYIGKPKVKIIR